MTKANRSSGSFRWKAPGRPTRTASPKRASHREPSSAWDSIRGGMENPRETGGCRVCSNVRRAPGLNLASIATRSPAPRRSVPASCRKRRPSRTPSAESCLVQRGTAMRTRNKLSRRQMLEMTAAAGCLLLWAGSSRRARKPLAGSSRRRRSSPPSWTRLSPSSNWRRVSAAISVPPRARSGGRKEATCSSTTSTLPAA